MAAPEDAKAIRSGLARLIEITLTIALLLVKPPEPALNRTTVHQQDSLSPTGRGSG